MALSVGDLKRIGPRRTTVLTVHAWTGAVEATGRALAARLLRRATIFGEWAS